MRAAAALLPIGLREQFGTPNGLREYVDAIVAQKLLRQEARKRGLHEREDLKKQVLDFQDRLTVQALLTEAERSLGPPTERELRDYYTAHAAEFRAGPRVRVSRLLLHGVPTDAGLRKRLESLRARLLKKEPVEKLAALGEGPERGSGGDVGWIAEATDAETTLALGLKAGEVSPVVECPTGLAVLVASQRVEEHVPPFEELRETVAGRIAATRQRRAFDELVKQLRLEANVHFSASNLP